MFWILVLALIIAGAVWWMKNYSSEDILRRRYARGEISRKEYEQMKKEVRR